jgi:hypothetical protein
VSYSSHRFDALGEIAMSTCPTCGTRIARGDAQCGQCGRTITGVVAMSSGAAGYRPFYRKRPFWLLLPVLLGLAFLAGVGVAKLVERDVLPADASSHDGAVAAQVFGTKPAVVEVPHAEVTKLKTALLIAGSGSRASAGDTLIVNFVCVLSIDGREIESTFGGTPFTFILGNRAKIAGWDEALVGVTKGERIRIDVPASLAYGSAGNGQVPPNSSVTFIIDIVEIRVLVTNAQATTTTVPTPSDPEAAAQLQLDQLRQQDRARAGTLVNQWVPQVSAKRVGLVADGITYQPTSILQNHLDRRSRYDAILVSGADFLFMTKDPQTKQPVQMKEWYFTIVPQGFPSEKAANQWCIDNNMPTRHDCFAKFFPGPA